ncbi:CAP domain-containing protein [Lyngbya aestuarii]|uniref:CAP domain-containing protein n=1 Tax=Lyngbya aestuarii TaxID=118322 RepID=UPI00403DB651
MPKPLSQISWGLLFLGGVLSSCQSSGSFSRSIPSQGEPSPIVSGELDSSEIKTLEESVHQKINQYRQSRNLPSLTWDAKITQVSRVHSQAMASGKVPVSHQGFDQRVKEISQSLPYRGAAENVAYNQGYSDPGEQAFQGWLESPGHLKNIEGDFDLTGIGIAKNSQDEYYFTQIFIKRR